ncbi:DUF1841 family protein [Pseudomonadota bacterium]
MIVQDRNQSRDIFFNTWYKHNTGAELQGIEKLIAQVVLQHPEYHELLSDAQANRDREFSNVLGIVNPFLHMGMHLTITEQISIDNPAGIRSCYQKLVRKYADEHLTQNNMMDCLSDWLISIQSAITPDQAQTAGSTYLDCLNRQLGIQASG